MFPRAGLGEGRSQPERKSLASGVALQEVKGSGRDRLGVWGHWEDLVRGHPGWGEGLEGRGTETGSSRAEREPTRRVAGPVQWQVLVTRDRLVSSASWSMCGRTPALPPCPVWPFKVKMSTALCPGALAQVGSHRPTETLKVLLKGSSCSGGGQLSKDGWSNAGW